jgi:hypothetical protein
MFTDAHVCRNLKSPDHGFCSKWNASEKGEFHVEP